MAANPNSITAGIPALWAKQMQIIHHKSDVFRDIASFQEEALLRVGDTVHKPYRNKLVVTNTGADGSFTRQALTQTDETLVINKDKNVSFYVKELDEIQNQYDFVQEHATDGGILLSNSIDADVLAAGSLAATNVVDNSYFGGSAGDAITLNTANIVRIFTGAGQLLDSNNIGLDGRFGVESPQMKQVLIEALAGRESILGDRVSERGRQGEYLNFMLNMSNSSLWTGELLIGTTPTDDDTVVINGVTFTFKTTLGSTAGNVLIEGSAANSIANLVALINAPSTTTSKGVALTSADQTKMYNISAAGITGGIKVSAYGSSYIRVSDGLTAPADVWTPARQIQHNLFGKKGSIDVAVQKSPRVEMRPRDGFIGHDIISWEAYGTKVFSDGAVALVDVLVNSSSF